MSHRMTLGFGQQVGSFFFLGNVKLNTPLLGREWLGSGRHAAGLRYHQTV